MMIVIEWSSRGLINLAYTLLSIFLIYLQFIYKIFLFISALFMFDAGQILYLWQGWFPVDTSDTEDDSDTGNIVTTGTCHVSI